MKNKNKNMFATMTNLKEMIENSPTLALAPDMRDRLLSMVETNSLSEGEEQMLQTIFDNEKTELQKINDDYEQRQYEIDKDFVEKTTPLVATMQHAKLKMDELQAENEDLQNADNLFNEEK